MRARLRRIGKARSQAPPARARFRFRPIARRSAPTPLQRASKP